LCDLPILLLLFPLRLFPCKLYKKNKKQTYVYNTHIHIQTSHIHVVISESEHNLPFSWVVLEELFWAQYIRSGRKRERESEIESVSVVGVMCCVVFSFTLILLLNFYFSSVLFCFDAIALLQCSLAASFFLLLSWTKAICSFSSFYCAAFIVHVAWNSWHLDLQSRRQYKICKEQQESRI